MQVLVGNSLVNANNLDVIGSGGEGVVLRLSNGNAMKVYHQPTRQRSDKLQSFFGQGWNLPQSKVALPLQPVYNKRQTMIVGLTMPYLGTGFEDVAVLSNKKKRANLGITTRDITQLFLDGHMTLSQVHQNGLVVGDLSDLNVLFRANNMLWIDVDAWQFDRFPCPVATMEFVDPALYGIDLSKGPAFQPENDWYSYAVLLFRSLTLAHPFGGVHTKVKALTKRAAQRITIFDSNVKYPKIAIHPDILSDDIAQEFIRVFESGKREVFPRQVLEDYQQSLTECNKCKTWFPRNRRGCPVCNQRTMVVISRPVVENKNVRAMQFFRTSGDIVYSKSQDNMIYVVTHENGRATLHVIDKGGKERKIMLGSANKGTRYAIAGNLLVINSLNSNALTIYDISSGIPQQIHSTMTEIFGPSRKAAFQTTGNRVIRIVGGNIMAGEKRGTNYVEKHVRNGVPNQTWFSANGEYDGLQLFGFIQVLAERKYWYYLDGQNFELRVKKLNKEESLIDISVKFSRDGVVLRRKTQEKGVDYLRTDVINNDGKVTSSTRMKYEDHPVQTMHGQTYSGDTLLHGSDEGILQEKVSNQRFKTFKQTEPFVGEGDVLYKFNQGIVIIKMNTVTYLELT